MAAATPRLGRVQPELVLVEDGEQRPEADDHGGGETAGEYQTRRRLRTLHSIRKPSPKRGRFSSAETGGLPGAGRPALVGPRAGSGKPVGQRHEHRGGQGEEHERRPPAQPERQPPGQQRADELADGVARPVRAEHLRPDLRRGSSRPAARSGWRHHRPPHARPGPGRSQQAHVRSQPGGQRERAPQGGAAGGQADPGTAVGPVGQGSPRRMATSSITATRARIPEMPSPNDRRISGASTLNAVFVEFVDGVEPEQHDQREERLALGEADREPGGETGPYALQPPGFSIYRPNRRRSPQGGPRVVDGTNEKPAD